MGKTVLFKISCCQGCRSHYVSPILGMNNLRNDRWYFLKKNEESNSEDRQALPKGFKHRLEI